MTTLASNTISQTNAAAPHQSTSSTSSANTPIPTNSGQSDSKIAAASAGSRNSQAPVSNAAATKKISGTPPIVSSTTISSVPVVGGATGQNVRNTNASPVNGKSQVPPAVPSVPPPSGNVIVNGTSSLATNHNRKSSQAAGNSWTQNGNPHNIPARPQQGAPGQIQFGSFPASHASSAPVGNATVSSPNLSAPTIPSNPRVSSPQTSPSPLPQPTASGGPLQSAGIRGLPITFGSLDSNAPDRDRVPVPHGRPSMPPMPVTPAAPSHRRDSSTHSSHPEVPQTGMVPGRGIPPNGGRRGGNSSHGSQYTPPGHQYGNNFGSHFSGFNKQPPNHPRGSNAPVYNSGQYPNNSSQMGGFSSPRPPKSPAMHNAVPHPHSLPPTPQLSTVPMAASSPSFQHANLQPAPGYHQFMPPPQYDPSLYSYGSGYPQQQVYAPHFNIPPPPSPRQHFQSMQPSYIQPHPYTHNMSRSSSTAAVDINRPTSGIGISHPPMTPQPIPPQQLASSASSGPFKFERKQPSPVVVRHPETNIVQSFQKRDHIHAPPQPHPSILATAQSAPLITTSSPVIVQSAPSSSPPIGKEKTAEQKRLEIKEQVRMKVEAAKAEREAAEKERLRKEQEEREAEEKRKKEEEEKKRKEEEAERKRKEEEEEEERKRKEEELRKEEEEKKRREEEEERLRKEAEEQARLQQEEEERKRKEAEEAEAIRIAKERVEEEARLAKAKEDEEKLLKAEEDKEQPAEPATEDQTPAETGDAKPVEPTSQTQEILKVAEDKSLPTSPTPKVSDEVTHPPKKSKPQPLILQTKASTEPGLPSAALTALRSARPIEDINSIQYPSNILSPNPALNQNAPPGKFKYVKDFLLQFQSVFTEKPSVDWDQRIRETVGDPTDPVRPSSARTTTSGGLGPRNSRPGLSATTPTPPMGTMGAFGSGKSFLPPSMLTSAQRFEQSTRQQVGTLPAGGFSSFRPVPPSLSRTNSSTGLSQQPNAPGSPRIGTGNRSQRGSKRGPQPVPTSSPAPTGGVAMEKSESKRSEIEIKQTLTIPLSDVKPLEVSATRWKPRVQQQTEVKTTSVTGAATAEDSRLSPEVVQRKVKAALNKMTPEKFDKISDQILEIASQSKTETDGRTLRQVIQLTFEKATDEAAWSSMYAKFCKRMLESMDPNIKDESIRDKNNNVVTGGHLFRKYLLNRCQEEFERGWKVNLPPKPEGVTDEAAMLSDEYYAAAAAKRRGLGLIQFIGELFKLGMLTERIMHECVKKLVDYDGVPEEEEVESLCKLLRTIGRQLDSTDKSRLMMEAYFKRIDLMMQHPQLPSRIKFMLMDIIDLRQKRWETNEADKGPKTIAEIHADALKAQQEKEAAARAQQQRRPVGRGDGGRTFSSSGFSHQQDQRISASNTLNTDELRKLQSKNRNISVGQSTTSFGGPPTMFARSGSSSGTKKTGLGGLGFNREDSNPSSRTGTPPAGIQRESPNSKNPFGILADQTSPPHEGDNNDSISPAVSAASSPPIAKARPDDRVRASIPKSDSKA